MLSKVKAFYHRHIKRDNWKALKAYYKSFTSSSFDESDCRGEKQYEANITRLYHTIEKGLAYTDFRPGFGKSNVILLIETMKKYHADGGDIESFFYKTSLSVLFQYVLKNKECGYEDKEIEEMISSLSGTPNQCGGVVTFVKPEIDILQRMCYEELIKSRHSIRHFDSIPLDIDQVNKAIALAQYTPSACNRQGWRSRVVVNKKKITQILQNQNGNRGFGHEFDKLIVVTGDLRYFSIDRELHQVFIDGGMYAMRVLDSLYYYGIASVPLSASLTREQEDVIRPILNMNSSEVFILMIGIGNYPARCQTTRSERRPVEVEFL